MNSWFINCSVLGCKSKIIDDSGFPEKGSFSQASGWAEAGRLGLVYTLKEVI